MASFWSISSLTSSSTSSSLLFSSLTPLEAAAAAVVSVGSTVGVSGGVSGLAIAISVVCTSPPCQLASSDLSLLPLSLMSPPSWLSRLWELPPISPISNTSSSPTCQLRAKSAARRPRRNPSTAKTASSDSGSGATVSTVAGGESSSDSAAAESARFEVAATTGAADIGAVAALVVVALEVLVVLLCLGAGDAERRRVSEVGDTKSFGATDGAEDDAVEASAGGFAGGAGNEEGLGGSGAPLGKEPRRSGRLGLPTGTCAGLGGSGTAGADMVLGGGSSGVVGIKPVVGVFGGSGAPFGKEPRRWGRRCTGSALGGGGADGRGGKTDPRRLAGGLVGDFSGPSPPPPPLPGRWRGGCFSHSSRLSRKSAANGDDGACNGDECRRRSCCDDHDDTSSSSPC